jgi:mannosyl-oligosaccharide alpha-1,2-mannosidase
MLHYVFCRQSANNRETLIAEVGTVQLEFMMLSQLTGNPIYGQKVLYPNKAQ